MSVSYTIRGETLSDKSQSFLGAVIELVSPTKLSDSSEVLGTHSMTIEMAEKLSKGISKVRGDIRVDFCGVCDPFNNSDVFEILKIFRLNLPSAIIRVQSDIEYLWDVGGFDELVNCMSGCYSAGVNIFLVNAYKREIYSEVQLGFYEIRAIFDEVLENLCLVDCSNNPDKLGTFSSTCEERFFFLSDMVGRSKLSYWSAPEAKSEVRRSCTRPFRELSFSSSGKLRVCGYDWKNDMVLGKFPEKDIEEVWNSKYAHAIRYLLSKNVGSRSMPPCNKCDFKGGSRPGLVPVVEYKGGIAGAEKVLLSAMNSFEDNIIE